MEALQVNTVEDARAIVEHRHIKHVKIGVCDIDGVLRGKYISRDKFFSALDHGMGFCDVVLGWDSNDQLYDNTAFTGWHSGYPDATVKILPHTCREIPFEENTLFFLCEFNHAAETLCPRGILRSVLDKAKQMGFEALAALEYEFFLFDETHETLEEKSFRNLKPISPGSFGYSILRNSVFAEFYQELLNTCEIMDIGLESLHTETGPGVLEAAIGVDSALRAGDKANLFKTFTKVIAQRRNWMATFMAKWSKEHPGQSGHIHLSLRNLKGDCVFHDSNNTFGMSKIMHHFVAGQQALMPEFLSMIAPTVNSYTRLIPGYWAPTVASWGVENRTCALRVIPGNPKSQRVEYRVAGADCNPCLGLAAALGSGLWGIEQQLELGEPITGNAYTTQFPEFLNLPSTLWDAAQLLRHSKAARTIFGDAFIEHFVSTREWEEREARKHISDWQMQRYFEII